MAKPNDAVSDNYLVDFEQHDSKDPLNWPKWHKWTIILLLTLLSASAQLSTVIAAPVAPQIQHDLNFHSTSDAILLVTIWELGEVVGPLMYGPLSERYGRRPVMNATSFTFVLFSLGCALAPSIQALISLRFFNGMSVAVISVAGGIVGDLFIKSERGLAMSLYMVGSQIGPTLGPIVGSYLGEQAGWRWAFWLATILAGVVGTAFACLYRESYRVKILESKVKNMKEQTGNMTLRSKYDSDKKKKGWKPLLREVLRPFHLLTHSWALVGLTIYVSVYLGLFYLALTAIAPTFQRVYGFSEGQSGLAYIGLFTGMILGCIFFNVASRFPVMKLGTSRTSHDMKEVKPERHLIPSCMAGIMISAGFFLYGWALQYRVHWIAPIIGTSLVGLGYFVATVSVRAYIVDAFGIHAVSASAAMLAFRNATAAILPLLGSPLFDKLGEGWGGAVLGFIALALVPVPVLYVRYGERLRKQSKLLIQE